MIENKNTPPTLVPDVVLDAFAPVEKGSALFSPNFKTYIRTYGPQEGTMWEDLMNQEKGSLGEEDAGQHLAGFYLIKTADKLQDAPINRGLWIERFNAASSEVYGAATGKTALEIIGSDSAEWRHLTASTPAKDLYDKLAQEKSTDFKLNPEMKVLESLRPLLLSYIPEITSTIESLPEGQYSSAQVRGAFQTILEKLSAGEPVWAEWEITNPQNKTMLAVAPVTKTIKVPDGRRPVSSRTELLGLAFHELGVHAMRSVKGSRYTDNLIAYGMPDYLDFEEGLGIVFEYIATGIFPSKTSDRYADIALASGAIDGLRLSRNQIIDLHVNRAQTRAQAAGKAIPTIEELVKEAHSETNRKFRGGDAIPILENGKIIDQAVNQKDIAYFNGFIAARHYIARKIHKGADPKALLDFLTTGKHDPTNPRHLHYLLDKGVEVL